LKTNVASIPQADAQLQRSVGANVPGASRRSRLGNRNLHGLLLQAKLQVGGVPLPQSAQPFARRLGIDPRSVSLHVDADLTGRTESKGFAVGNQIVIHPHEYAPGTPSGDERIRHELVHVAQQGQAPALVQREPAETPCGPVGFNSPRLYADTIPGGPFKDERIAIPYDLIVPLSDPMKDFDPAESRSTFTDPARLEQVYHDATQPVAQFANRWRAAWWLCTVVEPLARQIGEEHADRLYSIGCLTVKNCSVDFDVMRARFSGRTASGLRLRALVMKGFVDKARELHADLTILNNALLLLAAIPVARGVSGNPLADAGIPGKAAAAEGGEAASVPAKPPAPVTQPTTSTQAAPKPKLSGVSRPRQIPQQQQHQIPGQRIHPAESSKPHDAPAPARGSRHQRPISEQHQLTKEEPPGGPAPATEEELNRLRERLHEVSVELPKVRRAASKAKARFDADRHKVQHPQTPAAPRPQSTDPRVDSGPKVQIAEDYAREVGEGGIETQHPDASQHAAERTAIQQQADNSRDNAQALASRVRSLERELQRLREEVRRLERELEPKTDPDTDPHHQ